MPVWTSTPDGSPDLVMLLHCSAGSGRQWRHLAERLSADFIVSTPDLDGYGGRTGRQVAGRIGLADLAAPLAGLIGDGREAVHLVGHSFGGAIALELAVRLGSRLASLTLIEPVAFHLLRESDAADRRAFREATGLAAGVHRALALGRAEAAMAGFVDYWNGPGAWTELEHMQRASLAEQAHVVARDFRAVFGEGDMLPRYRRIVAPTLLPYGETSPAPTRRIAELLGRMLPWAATLPVAGAGHMLPLTHRPQVEAAVVEHLGAFARVRRTARLPAAA